MELDKKHLVDLLESLFKKYELSKKKWYQYSAKFKFDGTSCSIAHIQLEPLFSSEKQNDS